MNDILCRQLAIDYCCNPEDVLDEKNHFTEHRFIEGRRRYHEKEDCYLKLVLVNGKILFTGRKDIVEWCRENYSEKGSEWFLEVKNMRKLNERFAQDGYQIGMAHPFYISETVSEVDTKGYDIEWYRGKEIEQFRDDRARELASKHFLTGLTELFTPVFAGMMDKGLLRRDDPAMLAFSYTAPISALIRLCDREPEKTGEAMEQIKAFSRHFVKTYAETNEGREKHENSGAERES